jgi:hypothetical protein
MGNAAWFSSAFLGLIAVCAVMPARARELGHRLGLLVSCAMPIKASFGEYNYDYDTLGFDDFLAVGLAVVGTIEWGLSPNNVIRAKAECLSCGAKDSRREVVEQFEGATFRVTERLNYEMKAFGLGADYGLIHK